MSYEYNVLPWDLSFDAEQDHQDRHDEHKLAERVNRIEQPLCNLEEEKADGDHDAGEYGDKYEFRKTTHGRLLSSPVAPALLATGDGGALASFKGHYLSHRRRPRTVG
jgi:hypothetical protein